MILRAIGLLIALSCLPQKTSAAPSPNDDYIIYLHGAIIESMGRRPTHPRFGVYEYDQVLSALKETGAIVISEQRPKGTKVRDYAPHVVEQVKALMADGISAANITVIGFSKGGNIALRTSHLMNERDLNFIFLAACNPRNRAAGLEISGRALSIVETTDRIGSTCLPLKDTAKKGAALEEVTITTGEEHGAFYRPNPAWLKPLMMWMTR